MSMEHRQGRGDRRRHQRGGRRTTDRPGYAPLVMVVDGEFARRDVTETILARLHFAVAPVESADKALALMQAIRPELIVSPAHDAPRLRSVAPADRSGNPIPIVSTADDNRDPDILVDAIRSALRGRA
jgi:CheY-like chemotaxis protein